MGDRVPQIDTRGPGGFVLAAGSRSSRGNYRVIHHPVAELPDWLDLTSPLEPVVPARDARSLDRPVVSGWRAQAYLRAVVDGECRNVTAASGYIGVDGYTRRQVDRDIVDGITYGAVGRGSRSSLP